MDTRKVIITYKGVEIECWKGSSCVYINKRPFLTLLSAKMWITKNIKKG